MSINSQIERIMKYIERIQNQLEMDPPKKYAHIPGRVSSMKRFLQNELKVAKENIEAIRLGSQK